MDLALNPNTTRNYFGCLRRFLSAHEFTIDRIRDFLLGVENPNTYNNFVKAFKAYARFRGWELAIRQRPRWEPVRILPTKKQLQEFYSALDTQYERLAFIGYAVTGLRRHGLLDLRMDQIDRSTRAIIPQSNSLTKRTYITFYNEEFEDELMVWLKLKKKSDRLFPIRGRTSPFCSASPTIKLGFTLRPKRSASGSLTRWLGSGSQIALLMPSKAGFQEASWQGITPTTASRI